MVELPTPAPSRRRLRLLLWVDGADFRQQNGSGSQSARCSCATGSTHARGSGVPSRFGRVRLGVSVCACSDLLESFSPSGRRGFGAAERRAEYECALCGGMTDFAPHKGRARSQTQQREEATSSKAPPRVGRCVFLFFVSVLVLASPLPSMVHTLQRERGIRLVAAGFLHFPSEPSSSEHATNTTIQPRQTAASHP